MFCVVYIPDERRAKCTISCTIDTDDQFPFVFLVFGGRHGRSDPRRCSDKEGNRASEGEEREGGPVGKRDEYLDPVLLSGWCCDGERRCGGDEMLLLVL
ncbi:hypothetical protein E2C01_002586 [Portunus trituberculatus]|uniref:Uncharacterized protein n=1 Tax=Portunus trituberculatus TaxID=210409 RepID=A0A5B7CL53_PORTR|nr:hypothetical protein [Portunus trituberculatus]